MEEGRFEGRAGLKIFMRAWRPDGPARGVVVIVHGFNAHSGQYRWVAERLVADGLAVYALDLRGRGRSEGERFFVDTVEDYVEDVATLVAMAQAREPGLPVLLLGHSAGGVVACTYAIDHQEQLAGLICESSAFRIPAPKLALTVFKALGRLVPHAHVLKLKNEYFSRDPAVVEALDHDPLIAHESQPSKTLAALVRADERLERDLPRLSLPVLFLHGTQDKVTSPSGSQHFHDRAGSSDKTLRIYDRHFHDLLADVGKEEVMSDILSWIDARLPRPAEAPAPAP